MAANDFDRVRYVGSNSHADYFKVDDKFNVIGQSSERAPIYCLDCRDADCKHVELVKEHGEAIASPDTAPPAQGEG